MKKMKKIILSVIFICASAVSFAQTQTPPPTNKPAVKKKLPPKKDGYISEATSVADTVVPYAVINDEDKAYVKRVWREIDLQDSRNAVLASPKVSLIGILYEAVKNGELDMYAADDESFKGQPVDQSKGSRTNGVNSSPADTAFLGINSATYEINRANNEFFAANFTGIRVKEDWVLDTRRGVFEPRIVGIAPIRIDVKTQVDNNGNPIADPVTHTVRADTLKSVAGWFYFNDLREVLVKTKIANDGNDNSGLNFDDVFVKRLFYGRITKWSNAADKRIEDYISDPVERRLESERYQRILSDFEQNLWKEKQVEEARANKKKKGFLGLFGKN